MEGKHTESWLNPKVSVRASPIHGHGLFARECLESGDAVICLGGQVLTDAEFAALHLATHNSLAIEDQLNLLLNDDSPVVYGNHSCDANLWMADAVTLIARRAIMLGEEVTSDYALYTADLPFELACNCGSAACRGRVTHEDWRRRDVQERYAGHFSPFLNRRIQSPDTP